MQHDFRFFLHDVLIYIAVLRLLPKGTAYPRIPAQIVHEVLCLVPAELSQLLSRSLVFVPRSRLPLPAANNQQPTFRSFKVDLSINKASILYRTAEGTCWSGERNTPSCAVPSNRGSAATREAVIILLPGASLAEDAIRAAWDELRGSCHPQPECLGDV